MSIDRRHFLGDIDRETFPLATSCLVVSQSGTGRDQAPNDDIFLKTPKVITAAAYRGLGEYPGSLLEGRCRDEGLGCQ